MTPEQLVQILPWLVAAVIIEGVILTLLTFLVMRSKGEPPVIGEVFTVYKDGRLIKHVSYKDEGNMDQEILTAMLTVVQAFIKDSFGSRDSSDLKKIEFGRKRIFFESGKYIYMAVVYTGDINKKMRDRIMETIEAIESKYDEVLRKWDGKMGALGDVEEFTSPLLDAANR